MSVTQEIKTLLQSVPGIGTVYDRFINVNSEADVNDKLTADDRVNSIFFFETSDKFINQESFYDKERTRTFNFAFYYGYSFENDSNSNVTNIKEGIINVFNTNETLNESVSEHENINMLQNIYVAFGNVLCHLLIFELTVKEYLQLQ